MVLFLRGLWWRRGFSAAVLLVGIVTTAVAAIGPLYARAASESTLSDELSAASATTGLAFVQKTAQGEPAGVAHATAAVGSAAHVAGYGAAILGTSLAVSATVPGQAGAEHSVMVWRQGQCAHLRVITGRCPTAPGEAIVDDDALQAAPHWALGQQMSIYAGTGDAYGPLVARVTIVGSYRPLDTGEGFWFGHDYFTAHLSPAATSALKGAVDAVFVTRAQFRPLPPGYSREVDVDVPLDLGQVRLDNAAALSSRVRAVQERFPRQGPDPTAPGLRTGLGAALAAAANDRHEIDTATLVVVLELALLSWLVLFQVVWGAVEARGDEIALAKLRGLRASQTVPFALAEPLVLLLGALPLGFLLALGVTRALAATALVHGTPVVSTAASAAAVAAAFAGSAVAAIAAAVRTVTRPVLEQWRNTAPPRRGTRRLLALDLVVAALAVIVMIALRAGNGSRPKPIFLLAPTLLVLAVALVGIRLLPRVGRLGLAPTRASGRIALFLALRQTVRRRAGLRLAVLLAVAAGMATFAVCGEAVAQSNRQARAQTELGASTRVSAQFGVGHDPEAAVERADPDGRWAMASATWSPDGGPASGTVIGLLMGVQPERLAATGYAVRGQLSPAAIAAAVTDPGVVAPAIFTGTRLRVRMTTDAITGERPIVTLGIRRAHDLPSAVRAGTLSLGAHDYTAAVDCAAGCAFTGVVFDTPAGETVTITGQVAVQGVDAAGGTAATAADTGYRAVGVRLNDVHAWRSAALGYNASVRIQSGGSALRVAFTNSGASSAILSYADTPGELPIVAAPAGISEPARQGGVSDYTATLLPYTVRTWAPVLPDVLDRGAIGDLDYLRSRLPNFDEESSWSVWLSGDAPHDAVARLERAGLLVQNVRTETTRMHTLGRQGPALSLLLLLVCAVAAAVLAVGGTAVALLANSRRRSFELAALRVLRVPRKTLRRSSVVEQALLLGAAVVLGLPSGYVAARLVMPVVPEFSDSTPVVLRYSPPVLVALACAAAFALLLWFTAVLAGSALARASAPARLREVQR